MKQTARNILVSLAVLGVAAIGSANAVKKSLYDRIGIHKLAQGASNCIDMEFSDKMLLMNDHVKMNAEQTPKSIMKFGLTAFLANVAGGPQMPPTDIAALDKALMLSPEEREHAWMIRMDAFTKAGISKKDFLELKSLYLKKFDAAQPAMPGQETFSNPQSLYARLGGIVPISMVVNDFIDQLATDPVQLGNKNVVKSLTSGKVTAAGLKYLVTEQLAMAAGGPFKYTGKSMKESHKDLAITEKEWQSAAAILKKVLDGYKVPAKEQGEIFAAISASHNDIVKK